MRLQVGLLRDVAIRVLAKVVFEQGKGHHQRHDAVAVLADDGLHFLLVVGADGLLEVAADVLQHVGVSATGGAFSGRSSVR